ncbi:pyrroline-5-carboxylate reductase [Desertibacillus haloalkaliphilus]|uniref:pyrroline-5-carboxylate reductase n=1 Tax=Desertibacillus haloalkaliphilus TaxID=1328930 RepID=UPI001C25CFFC|nr:pyrroline-5-carboxylate reductase [Desertibacillus haloalkaliphilus]MBU8907828.1 pyrroline-5-carboxylate reductase [Desertibacillus haloalkaliphilus]
MLENKKITFLGAGSMAESIIAGLIKQKLLLPEQIYVTNRSDQQRLQQLRKTYGVQVIARDQALKQADFILLAMKPKDAQEGLEAIKEFTSEDQLFLSVLAGTLTDHITSWLGHHAPVVRVMPNTSAKVGASATALAPGAYANDDHMTIAKQLFEAIGTVTVVDEEQLDAVTGLSGSGPAYIYYFVEAMEQTAKDLGLDEQDARTLIIQTVFGAAERLKSTSKPTADLYKEVMSPGGTTEAGFTALQSYKFQEAISKAIHDAAARSKELGRIPPNRN